MYYTSKRPLVRSPKPDLRRLFVIGLFGLGLLAVAAPGIVLVVAQQQPFPIREDDPVIPNEISGALKRAAQTYARPLDGVRWTKIQLLRGSDHRMYQVQGVNRRGNKVEVEVTAAGRIVETEEHGIPAAEVPKAVLETLKAKLPQFEPVRIEAIYQTEKTQPVSYGFEGRTATGAEIEVYITADGKTFLN